MKETDCCVTWNVRSNISSRGSLSEMCIFLCFFLVKVFYSNVRPRIMYIGRTSTIHFYISVYKTSCHGHLVYFLFLLQNNLFASSFDIISYIVCFTDFPFWFSKLCTILLHLFCSHCINSIGHVLIAWATCSSNY